MHECPASRGFPGLRLLLAFSVYTNGAEIMNLGQRPGQIASLHCLRAFSITWVIVGHSMQAAQRITGCPEMHKTRNHREPTQSPRRCQLAPPQPGSLQCLPLRGHLLLRQRPAARLLVYEGGDQETRNDKIENILGPVLRSSIPAVNLKQ